MREPTAKQATKMLAALSNLQADRDLYSHIADVRLTKLQPDGSTYKWEYQALAMLRWHLLNLGATGSVD